MEKLHGRPKPPPHGIDPRAFVHPTAQIGADASILPFAVVGEGSVIGADAASIAARPWAVIAALATTRFSIPTLFFTTIPSSATESFSTLTRLLEPMVSAIGCEKANT